MSAVPSDAEHCGVRLEYRVRWRREGLQRATAIYQTEQAARAKADRLLAMDALGTDGSWCNVPPLAEKPTIEARPVGEWAAAAEQVTEPSDKALVQMEEWLMPGSQSGVAF
jgi:hypothetical protein